jgi:cysteine-rich repeat protein
VTTDDCLPVFCTAASCGDGYIWDGVEECDDGNDVDGDECINVCTVATCGDGVKWDDVEQCDDGNDDDGDVCGNDCVYNLTPASCELLLIDDNMWGKQALGIDLRLYTNSTLHYIGCNGDGCSPQDFYCDFDINAETLAFGASGGGLPRAMVDPDDENGDMMAVNYSGCCNQPLGLCNSFESTNNGVNVDNILALCNALGYEDGSIVREGQGNSCPEVHALTGDGTSWSSDFVNSLGFGAEYECHGFL